jgi:hypothetical protein
MEKQVRGYFEEKFTKVDDVSVSAVKLFDNKPVHLLSSFAGAHPTSKVQR